VFKKKKELALKSKKNIEKNLIIKNDKWILESCMKVLLEDGCDPNVVDNQGETLLIDAIKKNKLQSMNLLLSNDCQANIKNKQGISPLGQAIISLNA
jgi:ankyrin repeat protein